jgi:iron complex transport system ATP-binding protein
MIIEVRNLSYAYGKKQILNDMSFGIAEGDFCAIMGQNGCGKTTLLKCIANLLPIKTNTIFINGKDTTTYSIKNLARQIAFVPQHTPLDFEFSAFETVLMGRNPYQTHLQNESQEDWDIVEECMKKTNTWHLRFATLSEMSGGEMQRVLLARALAQQTPIMLLDEPLSNLDISHQFEIIKLLRTISQNEKKTILLIVHDLNMAIRYCQSLLLLHNHSIVYHGDIDKGLTPQNIKDYFGVEATRENINNQYQIIYK